HVLLLAQHLVDDQLDESGQAGRSDGVDEHPAEGPDEAAAIGPRVREEPMERPGVTYRHIHADAYGATPMRCGRSSRDRHSAASSEARSAPCAAPRITPPRRPDAAAPASTVRDGRSPVPRLR